MHRGPKTLGERLKQARLRLGLTQMQLAAKARLGQSAISSLESGNSRWAQSPNLLKLAIALDVDPYWLETGLEGPQTLRDQISEWDSILRSLTPQNRQILLGVAETLLRQQPRKTGNQ